MRYATLFYFIFFLAATTWPGFLVFNRTTPFILELPFNLFCLAVLILVGMGVLFALYLTEKRR